MAQMDRAGSGRAIKFDNTDDYIDLGNVYDDLRFPVTISAWVYVEPSTQYILPIFATQDNAPIYNGLWFCLSGTNLFVEYGDGRGQQNSAYRRGKSASIAAFENRWINVSAVIKTGDDIQLYVNGSNAGGQMTGSSTQPMASNFPNDVAKIGYLYTNDVIHRFKGDIDELRFYNRALTEQEIRATMCKRLKGDEPGLIGYWNFDEISGDVLRDLSPNGFDGVLKGNPTRVFSGAPIGDESVFLYANNWTGSTLSKNGLSVSNVSSNAYGVHIYTVDQVPSQTGGLNLDELQIPYYGVFLADDAVNNTFDITFSENSCDYFERQDNSQPTWSRVESFSGIRGRIEIVASGTGTNEDIEVDLGPDLALCNAVSYELQAHPEPEGKSFSWNTGATTPSITVNSSGIFSVLVQDACQLRKDTIHISFATSPPPFSFGEDELSCDFEPRILSPDLESEDFTFLWQDGSNGSSLVAEGFGTYWLKLENDCGVSSDTITFIKKAFTDLNTYNFISPNNRDDRNQFFIVDERLIGAHLSVFNRWGKPVFETSGYQNDWDGDDLPSGVYFYTITSACIDHLKGTLTIMR